MSALDERLESEKAYMCVMKEPTPQPPKLCKDCKHRPVPVSVQNTASGLSCQHPNSTVIDLEVGLKSFTSCRVQRSLNGPSHCGKDARWFEPKEGIRGAGV